MKFKFCGDLDCPDWILAEINTLSKLSSVKMKVLCVQVVGDILGTDIDYEKVNKLTSDAKFEQGDVKASLAALNFIISSAAKNEVDSTALSDELQQLGLPKEHTTGLCKTYSDNVAKVHDALRKASLSLSRLESLEWRVDYILGSSNEKPQSVDSKDAEVKFKLQITDAETMTTAPVCVMMSADKFLVFQSEMKQAKLILETLAEDLT